MADDIFSSVGTCIAVVATAPATFDEAGFSILSYVQVAQAAEAPAFGAEAALATHTALCDGIVRKRRGSVNYGSVTIPLALSDSDAGQAILRTAGQAAPGTSSLVSVQVTLPTGDKMWFQAEVMSFKTNIGNADAIAMGETTLEISSAIVFEA